MVNTIEQKNRPKIDGVTRAETGYLKLLLLREVKTLVLEVPG